MKQLDLQVIQQALTWLAQGQPVWLCTVLSTFGSAPRAPGAMLVALPSGAFCGSLSGGCVEEDFLERVVSGSFATRNQLVRYGEGGLTPTRALPCGGVLDVLVEYIPPGNGAEAMLRQVEQALGGGELLVRDVPLGAGGAECRPGSMVDAKIQRGEECVSIRVGAVLRVILAGWSPVAEFCASFALSLGYEVILCDPRPEVVAEVDVPGMQVLELLPARFIAEQGAHRATAILALTHDPRMDDLTLIEAVRTEAFYIGAMGSQRTSAKRLERLARLGGLQADDMARIHAPIGLQLGSKSPAEIALATMADVLRAANGIARSEL
ncbi:XdhC family protein [Phytopseudomonas seleniipraecipitans]|uniref:Xanthine dehydrogenase accessory factor n=1 Tax=Phytopseudomonas seleniipraecipitans TaxID=640205 RepID=A0A1G7JXL7_9GAMM|nr:XdhC family protein [Pseudomonas seleniipraecipitans]SDF29592.1 xanthine dehydrogenase accessory factor [Pseudomonas seleniipraecipitans]